MSGAHIKFARTLMRALLLQHSPTIWHNGRSTHAYHHVPTLRRALVISDLIPTLTGVPGNLPCGRSAFFQENANSTGLNHGLYGGVKAAVLPFVVSNLSTRRVLWMLALSTITGRPSGSSATNSEKSAPVTPPDIVLYAMTPSCPMANSSDTLLLRAGLSLGTRTPRRDQPRLGRSLTQKTRQRRLHQCHMAMRCVQRTNVSCPAACAELFVGHSSEYNLLHASICKIVDLDTSMLYSVPSKMGHLW